MEMLGFILLRGKDFSLPDGVSTAVIGLFFGLVCGLFYYQHYYRQYFWWLSLGGGLIFTYIAHYMLGKIPGADPSSLEMILASFIIPFCLTLGLNHYLYLFKRRKRKSRTTRVHSKFFDAVDAHEVLRKDAVKVSQK